MSSSALGIVASSAPRVCTRYVPHAFLRGRCRDCAQQEADHTEAARAAAGQPSAPSTPVVADASAAPSSIAAAPAAAALLKQNCSTYTPHAFIYDRCRDCGRSEASHAEGALGDAAPEGDAASRRALGVLRTQSVTTSTVQKQVDLNSPGKIDPHMKEQWQQESASHASHPSLDIGKLSVNNPASSSEGPMSPAAVKATQAEAEMRGVVADHAYFAAEMKRAAESDAARLAANQISQSEFDRREKELQEAFAAKEEAVRLEAEAVRLKLEEANAQRQREIEENAARTIAEAQENARRQVEEAQQQTRLLLEEAERERAAALAFKREAEDARALAQADALLQRQLAEAAIAEAQQSKEESERKRLQVESQLKEVTDTIITAELTALAAAEIGQDDVEEQPAAPATPAPSTKVAVDGDVQLSDVLKSVEKLFQQGRNVVRFTGNKPATFSSVFIRELTPVVPPTPSSAAAAAAAGEAPPKAQYSICWARADQRLVHPTRSLDFSDISAVVIGKQSTVLKTKAATVNDRTCVSFISGNKSAKPSLHLQFGNERDRDTWAFGIASLMKEFGIKPAVFEKGTYFEQEAEKDKDYALPGTHPDLVVEEDDGALEATEAHVRSIAHAREAARYQIELSCKCDNLPSVHSNTIVCLVDRNERTNKLEYLNQSEKKKGTNCPRFEKKFPLVFLDSAAKTLRFNVYDVPEGSKNIEDEYRLGSAIVSIKSLVDKPGADFVYTLSHKHPKKAARLAEAASTISVSCVNKKLLSGGSASSGEQEDPFKVRERLRTTEKLLAQGDTFTNYVEGIGAQAVTLFYLPGVAAAPSTSSTTGSATPTPPRRLSVDASAAPAAGTSTSAAPSASPSSTTSTTSATSTGGGVDASGAPLPPRFELGSLSWSTVGAAAESMPLRSIVDVFVGRKYKAFPAEVRDDHAFSLVSKKGIRLDLEAKSKALRDQWVQGIIAFLKAATAQQQRDKAEKAERLAQINRDAQISTQEAMQADAQARRADGAQQVTPA